MPPCESSTFYGDELFPNIGSTGGTRWFIEVMEEGVVS
jgi:hypothetical protein